MQRTAQPSPNRPPGRHRLRWPPPTESWDVRAVLERAERTDPTLAAAHLGAALFWCAAAGLSPAFNSIAFAALMVTSLLRLWSLRSLVGTLLLHPVSLSLLALTGWLVLGVFWTPDREEWFDEAGALRILLVLPALWPLVRTREALAWAIVVGVNIQNLFQLAQHFDLLERDASNVMRHAGLGGHPGHVTTWACAALLLTVALVGGRSLSRSAVAAVALSAGLSILGVVLAAGRAPILAFGPALLVTLGCLALFHRARILRSRSLRPVLATAALFVVLVGAVAALGGWSSLNWQVSSLGFGASPSGSVGQRLVWWSAARELAREHPIRGLGLAGFEDEVARTNAVISAIAGSGDPAVASHLKAAHPHSVYLALLVDAGVIGLALFGLTIIATATSALRVAQREPLGAALLGILVLWLLCAAFESLHLNGSTLGLLVTVMAFATMPDIARSTARGD